MIMVVTNRHRDDHRVEWLLSAPIDRPMLAMITSVDPRALRPVARASDSSRQSAELAADQGSQELAEAGDHDDREREESQCRIEERPQVHAEAGDGEEDRAEEGDDEATQFALDMLCQDCD